MTPEQKASHARELLNNPVLREVLDGIENAAILKAIHAASERHDERMAAAADIRAARGITNALQSIVDAAQQRAVKSIA